MNKCELMSLKQCDLPSICGIPIKNEVTYLGIKIVKDEERRCELNFSPIIDKTKKKLNHWLDLTNEETYLWGGEYWLQKQRASQGSHIPLFL